MYITSDPPEIEIERSWIHTGIKQEALLTCTVHAEPAANVRFHSVHPSVCVLYIDEIVIALCNILSIQL